MIDIRLNNAAIAAVLRSPSGEVAKHIQRLGNRVLNRAVSTCPSDTGKLRNSIKLEMRMGPDGPYAQIGSNEEYALWVHEGTGIYAGKGPITPKRYSLLRWPNVNNRYKQTGGNRRYSSGATAEYVYARSVKGMKGRPWLKDALKAI
jgi:hypothetical protein